MQELPVAISNRVLIEKDPEIEKIGSIILPDKEESKTGTIVAVGPGRLTEEGNVIPLEVKVGDRVAIRNIAQTTKLDSKEYYLVREPDILYVMEG